MTKKAAELRGQVFTLGNLLTYQAGAVVSRTLIQKDTGTVMLFAFDARQGLSEHTAPFDALVQILDGSVRITIAGKPLRLQAGDCVILPAQKPHALQAVTRFKMLLTMIKSPPPTKRQV